ncbi:hypothetical protein BLOT_010602 [Blomia tropicalis]|nr:hypothetical protein BLOT_010602 [Blomia tropicalis]
MPSFVFNTLDMFGVIQVERDKLRTFENSSSLPLPGKSKSTDDNSLFFQIKSETVRHFRLLLHRFATIQIFIQNVHLCHPFSSTNQKHVLLQAITPCFKPKMNIKLIGYEKGYKLPDISSGYDLFAYISSNVKYDHHHY